MGLISGLGRSLGGGHGNPLLYSCLENPQRQWSLVGYSPWGCKESGSTEATEHSCTFTLLSRFRLLVTSQTAARQAPLSFPISQSLLKFMSIESVIPHDPAIMLNVYPNKFKYHAHTKMLHTNVYSSFIQKHQKLEATTMSFSR